MVKSPSPRKAKANIDWRSSGAGTLCLASSLAFLVLTSSHAAEAVYSARFRFWHEPSNTTLQEALVIAGTGGLRVEQRNGESHSNVPGNVMLVNHEKDAIWFLDSRRQLAHSVPVISSSRERANPADASFPVPLAEQVSPAAQAATPYLAGAAIDTPFRRQPCDGIRSSGTQIEPHYNGQTLHRGRVVEHWFCFIDNQQVEEHWYAPTLGVVVRTKDLDGFASELTEFHELGESSVRFSPPSHYRLVEIEELINPAVPISSYIEKKNGQH